MTPFIHTLNDHKIEIHPRRNAQAKRLNMRFDPLKDILILTLPPRATKKHMADFLKQAHGWIQKKILTKGEGIPFKEGLIIPLLGKNFTLKHQSNFKFLDVKIQENILTVYGSPERFNDMVTIFLKHYAKEELTKICETYAKKMGKTINRITLRNQKSRWGSCSSQGNISLNWRLLFTPRDVAVYVCIHEVAHLTEMNHSPSFWKIVSNFDPAYKDSQQWLKKKGDSLFHYGIHHAKRSIL